MLGNNVHPMTCKFCTIVVNAFDFPLYLARSRMYFKLRPLRGCLHPSIVLTKTKKALRIWGHLASSDMGPLVGLSKVRTLFVPILHVCAPKKTPGNLAKGTP